MTSHSNNSHSKTCAKCVHYKVERLDHAPDFVRIRCMAGERPVFPELALRSSGRCGPSRRLFDAKTLPDPGSAVGSGASPTSGTGSSGGTAANWFVGMRSVRIGDSSPDNVLVVSHVSSIARRIVNSQKPSQVLDFFEPGGHLTLPIPPFAAKSFTVSHMNVMNWYLIAANFFLGFGETRYRIFHDCTANPHSMDGN